MNNHQLDYSTTIGFLDKPLKKQLNPNLFISTVGGSPKWINSNSPRNLICKKCNHKLVLLCQIYTPYDESLKRYIYIFCCLSSENCLINQSSWRAIRGLCLSDEANLSIEPEQCELVKESSCDIYNNNSQHSINNQNTPNTQTESVQNIFTTSTHSNEYMSDIHTDSDQDAIHTNVGSNQPTKSENNNTDTYNFNSSAFINHHNSLTTDNNSNTYTHSNTHSLLTETRMHDNNSHIPKASSSIFETPSYPSHSTIGISFFQSETRNQVYTKTEEEDLNTISRWNFGNLSKDLYVSNTANDISNLYLFQAQVGTNKGKKNNNISPSNTIAKQFSSEIANNKQNDNDTTNQHLQHATKKNKNKSKKKTYTSDTDTLTQPSHTGKQMPKYFEKESENALSRFPTHKHQNQKNLGIKSLYKDINLNMNNEKILQSYKGGNLHCFGIRTVEDLYEEKYVHDYASERSYALYDEYIKREQEGLDVHDDSLDLQDLKGSTKWDKEEYETTHTNKLFLRFQAHLKRFPNQIIRYCFNGNPLLLSEKTRIKAPNCPNCNSKRAFELQILPTLLYELNYKVKNISKEFPALSLHNHFANIIIYSCSEDCTPQNTYLDEYVLLEIDNT